MDVDITIQQELIKAIAAFNREKSWFDTAAAIALVSGAIALLGAIITHIFNTLFEKRRFTRDIAIKHVEFEIRKLENIQAQQIEALKSLSIIKQETIPTVWPKPEYEEYEAHSDIVFSMSSLLDKLNSYLKDYSYILPGLIIEKMNKVIYICNQEHWGASLAQDPGYEPSEVETDAAKSLINELSDAVTEFKNILGVKNA